MKKLLLFLLICITCGCSQDNFETLFDYYSYFDFKNSIQGWEIDVANYPADEKDSLLYSLEHNSFSENNSQKVLQVSVDKVPVDAYIFIRNQLRGLQPSKKYHVFFEIKYSYALHEEASNPVHLFKNQHKIGISESKPTSIITGGSIPDIRLNIEQNMDGIYSFFVRKDSLTVNHYDLLEMSNQNNPLTIETDAEGECWFFVGSVVSTSLQYKIKYSKIVVYWKEVQG